MDRTMRPAVRLTAEPPQATEGWAAADLTEHELVDDEFIDADPDAEVVTDGPPHPDVR